MALAACDYITVTPVRACMQDGLPAGHATSPTTGFAVSFSSALSYTVCVAAAILRRCRAAAQSSLTFCHWCQCCLSRTAVYWHRLHPLLLQAQQCRSLAAQQSSQVLWPGSGCCSSGLWHVPCHAPTQACTVSSKPHNASWHMLLVHSKQRTTNP